MTKWKCIREISEYGVAHKIDAILKLLEWTKRPCTLAVTEEEANEFLVMLDKEQKKPFLYRF